jgi:hypothetical protein
VLPNQLPGIVNTNYIAKDPRVASSSMTVANALAKEMRLLSARAKMPVRTEATISTATAGVRLLSPSPAKPGSLSAIKAVSSVTIPVAAIAVSSASIEKAPVMKRKYLQERHGVCPFPLKTDMRTAKIRSVFIILQ